VRRLLIAAAALALIIVSAGAATAGEKGAERFQTAGTATYDDWCAFDVVEVDTATWMFTPSGKLMIIGHNTLTNPDNGRSVAGRWVENWPLTGEDGIHGSGLFWQVTVPGHGIILLESGYLLFGGPPEYPLLVQHGPSSFASAGDMEAFCGYLSS
jgi:hypothetical protein